MRHLVFACVALLIHILLLFPVTDYFIGYDARFHYAISRDMLEHGLLYGVRALPYTVLGTIGVDHHFLFHILLMPFAVKFSYELMLFASSFMGGITTIGFVYALKTLRVPLVVFFASLLFAATNGYLIRVDQLRMQSLAILLSIAVFVAMVKDRRILAGFFSAVFALTYHGAIVVVAMAVMSMAIKKIAYKNNNFKVEIWTLVGYCFGLIINPFGPRSLEYLMFHLHFKGANPLGLDVGAEWRGATLYFVVSELFVLHVLFLIVLYVKWVTKKLSTAHEALLAIVLTVGFIGLSVYHGRFLEYAIPFEILALALLAKDIGVTPNMRLNRAITYGMAICAGIFAYNNLMSARFVLNSVHHRDKLKDVSEFLKANTQEGEVVGNLYWDDFPFLYFFNRRNRYLTGLDPNYLAFGSPLLNNTVYMLRRHYGDYYKVSKHLLNAECCRFLVAKKGDANYLRTLSSQSFNITLKLVYSGGERDVWEVVKQGDLR